MIKKNFHPILFKNVSFFSNKILIQTYSTTKLNITLELWAGNHPFYTKSLKILDIDGRIKHFFKKYDS